MRKFIIALSCIIIGCMSANAQAKDASSADQAQQVLSAKDTTYLQMLSYMAGQLQPRYKMFKTENTYNLIKLDTATGALWQVQYGMNNSATRMEVAIDDTSVLYSWEEARPGRFDLYPTNNMYTFILLDTELGKTYQVQWSTNSDQRFRVRIY